MGTYCGLPWIIETCACCHKFRFLPWVLCTCSVMLQVFIGLHTSLSHHNSKLFFLGKLQQQKHCNAANFSGYPTFWNGAIIFKRLIIFWGFLKKKAIEITSTRVSQNSFNFSNPSQTHTAFKVILYLRPLLLSLSCRKVTML